jgi:hypothetical protein
MAYSIYEVLQSEQPLLVPILDKNHDVCTFLKASYDHLLFLTMGLGKKPGDLDLELSIINERLLKVAIIWKDGGNESRMVASKNPAQKNLSLVSFLKANPKVRDLAKNVIYILEAWIAEKPIRKTVGFEGLRLENPIAWRDGRTITAEIVLNFEFAQAAATKLKFEQDFAAPEQPNENSIVVSE